MDKELLKTLLRAVEYLLRAEKKRAVDVISTDFPVVEHTEIAEAITELRDEQE